LEPFELSSLFSVHALDTHCDTLSIMLQNGHWPTGKALSLSYVSNNTNMASKIWTVMNPSGIPCDVK